MRIRRAVGYPPFAFGAFIFVASLVAAAASARDLTFDERIAAQEAIERVYFAHQIGTTRPFEAVVPRSVLEAKVRKYLEETAALERLRRVPVTAELLERELRRIEKKTRFPERLLEVFAVLHNDPVVIQECFVRPVVVSRLLEGAGDSGIDPEDAKTVASAAVLLEGPARSSHPAAPETCLPGDSWSNQSLDDGGQWPGPRSGQGAVWNGAEMFIWGPAFNAGWRYDPVTDSWRRMADDHPGSNALLSADEYLFWTGSRIVVYPPGLLYDPIADTWQAFAAAGAPSGRRNPSVAFTGSQLIVWGGRSTVGGSALLADGAKYDLASNTWSPVAALDAPTPREQHKAVWSGSRMLIWGGSIGSGPKSGGSYDPVTNSWSLMSLMGQPDPDRYDFSAIWTGGRMVVWGGGSTAVINTFLNSGGAYDPASNSWASTSLAGAPSPRGSHTAVWTGSRVLVWGGTTGFSTMTSFGDGATYDPVADAWTAISNFGAPRKRYKHTAVWAGTKMIVFGGLDWLEGGQYQAAYEDGGRYDPASNTWLPTSFNPAPSSRHGNTVVWTGNLLIVWGGYGAELVGDTNPNTRTGKRYDPLVDAWTPVTLVNAPEGRAYHTAVWTGQQMVVWGGGYGSVFNMNTGGRYDPIMDSWLSTSVVGAPTHRYAHSVVWTGQNMIVWGGNTDLGGSPTRSGGVYNPATDSWTLTDTTLAPPAAAAHSAVWTGSRMVVWGGSGGNKGGIYDPATNGWTLTTQVGAPSSGVFGAVWTGSRMLLEGSDLHAYAFDPVANAWTMMSNVNAPPLAGHPATAWTGSEMIVWGGSSGSSYHLDTDSWTSMPTAGAPPSVPGVAGVWTGDALFVWGGWFDTGPARTGGRYIADPDHDGFTGSCDNCPALSNSGQDDADGDGRGDLCDNCASVSNVEQADSDADDAGDVCDCAPSDPSASAPPGEVAGVALAKGAATRLSWVPAPGGGIYDAIGGTLSLLRSTGSAADASCLQSGLMASPWDDTRPDPRAGESWYYLLRSRNVCGIGSYGFATGGAERLPGVPCP